MNNFYLISKLSTEKLFEIVLKFSKNPDNQNFIKENFKEIMNKCSFDYDLYNYFTILCMKYNNIESEKCKQALDNTINKVFSNQSKLFLLKLYKQIKENGFVSKVDLFPQILEQLKAMDTNSATIILFDLVLFPDFKIYIESKHPIIAILIEAYQLFAPDIVSSQLFKGSSVIGKLLKENKEDLIKDYLIEMLIDKQISVKNIKMIGGGGSNIVYKINDLVLKIGETRHNRKVYINHRILASLFRKLEQTENGEDLFYIEIMKYVKTGDVTPEERDELKKDLYDQGLIWEDDKLENCGLLSDEDDNICTLPVDYVEIAGRIDNPYRREEFMKRARKIVVIDNDYIRFNPLISSR